MTDQQETTSTFNVSGGVNVNSQGDASIQGDVVGRDKILIEVARLDLPLEKKGVFVWLKPNRRFSYGEVEDLKIYVDPREGYQFIFSFGFHWHSVDEQDIRELEAGYLQVGHQGSPYPTPPPARDSSKPGMGNLNLDKPIILKSPIW